MDPKKILVAGVGSAGVFLALKLANAGYDVEVLRSGKIKTFKTGDTVAINDEPYKMPKIIDELPENGKYNYLFLTCKLYDLRDLLKELSDHNIKVDLLVSIQNTLFDGMWYFDYIRDNPVVIVSTKDVCYLTNEKVVKSEPKGWFVEDDILGKDIANVLNKSGIETKLVSDLRKSRAEKTVIRCFSNALSVIENMTIKQMYDNMRVRKRMKAIFDETYDILSELVKMKAKRILWKEFIDSSKNKDHYSSAWYDLQRRKKTEIAFLNGYIVSLGKSLGKPTPENQKIIEEFRKKYPYAYYV